MKEKTLLASLLLITLTGCLWGGSDNLEVKVTNTENQPLDALVSIQENNGKTVKSAFTDNQGICSFELSSGTYSMVVTSDSYESREKKISVPESGKRMIGITLEKEGSCMESWVCGKWSECKNNKQNRTCRDENECGTTKNKPSETRSCEMPKPKPNCSFHDDCNDGINCTQDQCINGSCSNEEITSCINNDKCCPLGCKDKDNDCPVEDQCQSNDDCDDGKLKTKDVCEGTPTRCYNKIITACIDDDGYCPPNCDGMDNDCPTTGCSNDEDCDDNNDCTTDACINRICVRTKHC